MVSFELNEFPETTPPIKVQVWRTSAVAMLGSRRVPMTRAEFQELCERGLAALEEMTSDADGR